MFKLHLVFCVLATLQFASAAKSGLPVTHVFRCNDDEKTVDFMGDDHTIMLVTPVLTEAKASCDFKLTVNAAEGFSFKCHDDKVLSQFEYFTINEKRYWVEDIVEEIPVFGPEIHVQYQVAPCSWNMNRHVVCEINTTTAALL